ncbi:MAG: hypothetical protein NT180_05185 [Actinobacteria bacterium]|nr:hypothetical protein [Actinomycetota bacterium]
MKPFRVALVVLSMAVGLASVSVPAASAAPVEWKLPISKSGDSVLWNSTSGAGPKAYSYFVVYDSRHRASYFEHCGITVATGEQFYCRTERLRTSPNVKRKSYGWIITLYMWYKKAVSPSECDATNYNWPRYQQNIFIYNADDVQLGQSRRTITSKCSG